MVVSESNRTPFDFSESESELVSGFNVEYGGGLFSLIFVREYGMIIFMRFVTSVVFFGSLNLEVFVMLLSFLSIWVRFSFPRYRYDKLMAFSWLRILPVVISLLSVGVGIFFCL